MAEQQLSRGYFIAIEGLDGSGKSTAAHTLYNQLHEHGYPVILTREPGGTPVGSHIRQTLHADVGHAQAEFLLFAADRALHMEQVVIPYINAGYIVISDRGADSSRAYQGYGRGVDIAMIDRVNAWVMQGVMPDIVVFLDMPPDQVQNRIMQRGEETSTFDREQLPFFQRVRDGFYDIYQQRDAVIYVNALQPACNVARDVWSGVMAHVSHEQK